MFGLFNKRKKIAREVATPVLNSIRIGFATSKYIDERGTFHPPFGFWQDHYVVGFAYGLSAFFLKYAYNAASMKVQEKGEIIIHIFMILCENDFQQAMKIANEFAVSRSDDQFNLGLNHASTAFGAMAGVLKEDDADPIFTQAKSLAKKQHDINVTTSSMLGLSPSSTNSSIGSAVLELTIVNHIQTTYLVSATVA